MSLFQRHHLGVGREYEHGGQYYTLYHCLTCPHSHSAPIPHATIAQRKRLDRQRLDAIAFLGDRWLIASPQNVSEAIASIERAESHPPRQARLREIAARVRARWSQP